MRSTRLSLRLCPTTHPKQAQLSAPLETNGFTVLGASHVLKASCRPACLIPKEQLRQSFHLRHQPALGREPRPRVRRRHRRGERAVRVQAEVRAPASAASSRCAGAVVVAADAVMRAKGFLSTFL